jgi:hypothetical protein
LIDDLRWRGKMDIDGAALTARVGPAGGLSSIAFHGDLALSDLFLQLGVPVQVRSAAARDVELVYEEGALRAWVGSRVCTRRWTAGGSTMRACSSPSSSRG